jgi:hypothetical protein
MRAAADPQFVHAFPVSYCFETQQRMKVSVYDCDQAASAVHNLDLTKQDHLGSIEFDLVEVARGADMQIKRPLVGLKASGTCIVSAEERVAFKRVLTVDIRGFKLAKRDGYVLLPYEKSRLHCNLRLPGKIASSTSQRWQGPRALASCLRKSVWPSSVS